MSTFNTRLFILFLAVFLVYNLDGQANDPLKAEILSPQEMKEDLDLYHDLLTETHPGLHRYLSTTEFQKALENINAQISDSLPFYSFYQLIAGLASEIRCAHTYVFPKEDALGFAKRSCNLFPFFLYPIGDKLYLLFNGTTDTTITPGSELISINGRSVAAIRDLMSAYYFRDGHSNSVLQRFMQGGYFSLFYYFFIEQPDQFLVTFKKRNGETTQLKVPGQVYGVTERNDVNKQMMSFYNSKKKNWDFKILEELPNTASIRFASFGGKGMESEVKAQEAMQQFMDKAIKKMERKKITNLIVELRGNSGGWDIQGQELLSYLTEPDNSVPYYESQSTATIDSDFLQYSDITPEEMQAARDHLEPLDDGTYQMTPEGNVTLAPQVTKENNFSGSLYILVDEQCASSCAEFVAVAKSQGVGTFVGNESGGAYEGGNGGSFIHYHLPNSGIFSSTPLVRYNMATTPLENKGRGTIPDYEVHMTLKDILTGRDAQKEFALDLIRSK